MLDITEKTVKSAKVEQEINMFDEDDGLFVVSPCLGRSFGSELTY